MTSSAISTEAERARPGRAAPRRRRVPLVAIAASGALVAAGYAFAIEKLAFGPPLVMLALGGMTLALSGAALWRVIDPLTRGGSDPVVARGGRRARELDREKQLVLKAIKEVELDYQMRKIAERDYREMVERYRTRAMRLMTEIEAGEDYRALIEREVAMRLKLGLVRPAGAGSAVAPDAAETAAVPAASTVPAAAPPAPTCARCGARNDDDARFCKACGGALAQP
jgi:zinc ribbon protein